MRATFPFRSPTVVLICPRAIFMRNPIVSCHGGRPCALPSPSGHATICLMKHFSLLAVFLAAGLAQGADKAAQFYFVDIGHGNVTFVISPSGETMLLDCGPTRAADRIYEFMQQNGIKKIDYLFITHFEDDHMG